MNKVIQTYTKSPPLIVCIGGAGILFGSLSIIQLSYLVAVANDGQNLDANDAADAIAEDEEATPDEDDEDDSDVDVPEEDESSVSESEDSEDSPSADVQGTNCSINSHLSTFALLFMICMLVTKTVFLSDT